MKSQTLTVAIGFGVVVILVGAFAYFIARPSPPPPSGPPILRSTPTPPGPTATPPIPVTRDGYLACLSESDLDDVISFAAAGDRESVQKFVDRRLCIVLRAGVQVTIVRSVGVGKVEFAVRGSPEVRFYTIVEAISK